MTTTTAWVDVIILNYKGWPDTIECLESVLALDYPNRRMIVVDNCSGDDSVPKIRDWALQKAVPHAVLDEKEIGAQVHPSEPLVLIRAERNEGYSAGNNLGIRFSLVQAKADFVWLLNNDTTVRADSLRWLVERAGQPGAEKIGMLGSKILFYHQPGIVQYLGGSTYRPFTGKAYPIGRGLAAADPATQQLPADRPLDFVAGAALFASTRFIRDVGELNEAYFLYFEEIDWSTRGRRQGWSVSYEPRSIVYHKEGATIGASPESRSYRAKFADYYYHRNKFLFTRHYLGWPAFGSIYLLTVLSLFKSILNTRWVYARLFIRVLTGQTPRRYPFPD
ncbi:glycosyltransferase family 2 protein [Larkinella bovis]|uniref:Glycosyltransferase family 2 protein n=1 Tax=Larkinella bovis TaxID=683041 RepID=A0ABW0IKN1_9BACT